MVSGLLPPPEHMAREIYSGYQRPRSEPKIMAQVYFRPREGPLPCLRLYSATFHSSVVGKDPCCIEYQVLAKSLIL